MGKYSSYTDSKLVYCLRGKNANVVFEELYNRYWKKLLVQALLKLDSEMEAEEVVQDVFMDIWERRHTLEIRNSFYTYIASCIKYKIIARLAQRNKHITFKKEAKHSLSNGVNNTENWMDYETTRKQIEETVKRLPEKCRLVFHLSREEGYSQKEISGELGISIKTVETHITKALHAIRNSFKLFLLF